jgi:hypothetical protein
MIWQKKNFLAEPSAGIWMQITKWKDIFIENNITRNIYSASGGFKTLETFVEGAITEENTAYRAESKFVGIIRSEIWPTSAAKYSKRIVVRFFLQ